MTAIKFYFDFIHLLKNIREDTCSRYPTAIFVFDIQLLIDIDCNNEVLYGIIE